MGAQPRILMMEFEACRRATDSLEDYLESVRRIVQETDAHHKAVSKVAQSGYPG